MKKIFTFIAALTLSVGLFAEETILAIGPWEAQNWINQPTLLSDGGTELANIGAQAGDVINFYIEPTKEDWACQILEGHWGSTYALICAPSIASTLGYNAYDLSANGGKYALALTQEMIDAALTPQWWGGTFLINGDGVVVTKLTLVTSTIFVDDQSGLTFQIIDSDDVNNVMVIFTKNGYPTYSGDVVIPSTVNYHDTTFTVTQIGSNAFAGCSNLTSVTIPSSVTTIGEDAFGSCSGLTSINVDAANTHFCSVDGVLFNYAKDTLIHYPMGSTRTEYTIPNSVTTIGYKAFYDCSKLTSVTIPNSVTTIGYNAFFNILNIVYNGTASGSPWGAKCINGYVDGYFVYSDTSKTTLYGCSVAAMGEITIPNSVIIIGESAFHYCRDLTSVIIPNSVITIRYGAFDECSGLTSVTIGNSVTTIGGWAFHSCSSLTSVTIPNSVTTIGYGAFFECSGLTSVTIGNSVTTIEMQAFAWCGSLTSVTIPNSVTTIGENAFNGCGLTSISIPNSVTTIGGGAFSGSGLRDVSVAWTSSDQLPTMGVGVFDNIADWTGTSAATLHVLVGTKNIYETADQWKEFGTIIESIEPQVGNKFGVDGLWYEILTMGETNTVKVINNSNYKNLQTVNIPNSITLGGTRFDVVEIGGDAFSGCSSLSSVTIPNSVTTIGYDAFEDCISLTSIIIPNSVTTIGEWAFYYCTSFTTLTIPNSVTWIAEHAFLNVNNIEYHGNVTGAPWGAKCVNGYVDGYLVYSDATKTKLCGCSSVATGVITIPNSVTTIGESAFEGCTGLTTINIPNSVTTIGKRAFGNCSSLTSITIPNSVTTIADMAFFLCNSLTSVTIPNFITTIGKSAFEYCGLTSITIPKSVTTIGDWAFSRSGLRDVSVAWTSSDQLPTMGVGVFDYIADWGGPSVATLHVPEGTKSIYEAADQWKDFGTITDKQYDPKNYIITYTATEQLTNPYLEVGWTTFGSTIISHTFSNGMGTITCDGEITKIGDLAFYCCNGLTSVIIPNSVTAIKDMAFAFSGLTSINIPNSVTTIERMAFYNCSNLTSITIPESVTSIGEIAFYWCEGLTSIDVDAANTHYCSIDGVLFNYAKDTLIQYPIGNTRTEYTVPNSVTTIEGSAFFSCSGLTSVMIPNSVTTIGESAFRNCPNLTSITIPNSVTTIEEAVFYECSGLTSVTIGNSVTTIGDMAFHSCSSLTSVTIPNSVTTIGDWTFYGCSGLTSVTIPNSVTTIGEAVFYECSGLTSVTIGNSVTTIGDMAFGDCSSLTTITCYAVTPPKCGDDVFANVFEYISQNTKVYVPASALVDYQNAEGWKDLQLYPIAADVTPMDDENPIVTPTDQDVTITWAITDGADTYTLTITAGGEVVCVLTFNAEGQMINIAFKAPAADGARQAPAATLTTQGYQFTVTGLNPGTAYNYSVTATDAGGKTLAEHKGNFSTTGGTGFESVHGSQPTMHKYFHNGNFIIERNGVKYTPAGQKVK